MTDERRTILYAGRVQGVGFRWTTLHLLRGLELTGRVRNLTDGRVELVLEGAATDTRQGTERIRAAMRPNIDDESHSIDLPTGEFPDLRISP